MKTREVIECDVVCVGAGVAGLSCVLRLLKRARAEGKQPPTVLILEKGRQAGDHVLSGALVDMQSLAMLLSPEEAASLPVGVHVHKESLLFLTERRSWRLPLIPPPLRSVGCAIVSLSDVVRRLGELCEEYGAEIYAGMAVKETIVEDGVVKGVRLVDHGVDRAGRPKANYEPGAEVRARLTILGEGAAGILTSALIQDGVLAPPAEEPTYALGIKELIRIKPRPEVAGCIAHSFGYPLGKHDYGGGFIYGMTAERLAVALIVGLDYRDPDLDTHEMFRRFKRHPLVADLIAGGRVIGYGAKLIPEGGVRAVPGLTAAGVMVVGDAAGLVDGVRLKGVHVAVEAGVHAGDVIFECWQSDDWTAVRLADYERRLRISDSWRAMARFPTAHGWFQMGIPFGMAATALNFISGGRFPPANPWRREDRFLLKRDEVRRRSGSDRKGGRGPRELDLGILDDLYFSGTEHEEDQPSHLEIIDPRRCVDECIPRYGAPCTRFCPAGVYEDDRESGGIRIQASNCLHCRTCRLKCPLDNIRWHVPEGGGGPRYKGM